MSDPYRQPRSGDPFEPTARQVASWTEAAMSAAQRGAQLSPSLNLGNQSQVILVKNTTGSGVPRNGLLRFGVPVILPSNNELEFRSRVVVTGLTPQKNKPIVYALEPIANGQFGRCIAPGFVVPSKIDKQEDVTYTLARPLGNESWKALEDADVETDDRLVEVLWHESGTGEKWALILLPGVRQSSLTVLGPCAVFNPAVELDDTDFTVVYPGGCLGPSRVALNVKNVVSGVQSQIVLELQSTSPLILSSDVFAFQCESGTVDVWVEYEPTTLGLQGVELRFMKESDETRWMRYWNNLAAWDAKQGGYLQAGPEQGPCNCVTFPPDLCVSIPTR